MSVSLLSTKFYIPPTRANAIARPRLNAKLLSVLNQPGSFALLSGPAGFGKTTLLSGFVPQLQQPVAWLSLDEGDNDPIRFWTYLITAFQTVEERVGESALALLRTSQPMPDNTIPTILINELARLERNLLLVLDDYHTIQNPSIHASFGFLLEHKPEKLNIVVSTRVNPPWPLARYRARNQLIEIRAHDLRFSVEEAMVFLNSTMGLNLSAKDVAALEERTEGWVTGLQLAALSMQECSDIGAFILAFTGSHVYIADYLIDEVLKRQPEGMQTFLLQTSILERLNASLCEAFTGFQDAQTKLTALRQANIFIVPLDDEGRWFRYHHLFADLLKARLQAGLSKAAIGALHQRAAVWFEQEEMVTEAIDHALAAADYAYAVRLVEKTALPMMLQGYVRTVERWLQAIPPGFVRDSPGVNMAYAWMNLLHGTHLQAIPYIERLKVIFFTTDSKELAPSLQGEWLAILSELLIAQGKPEESRDMAIQALKILPEVNPQVRSMIYVTLAKAFQQALDFDRAAEVFQMITRDARNTGDYTFELLGTSGLAQMVLKQGRLHRTYEIVNEGIGRLEASGKKTPFSATLYEELGQVYFQWHQLDRAKVYLLRSMEVSGKSGYSDPEIYNYLMLSKIFYLEGDLDASVREMQKASDLASVIPPVMIRENVIAQQVCVDLATNRLTAAEHLLEAEGFSFGQTFRFPDLTPGFNVYHAAGLLYNSALRVLLYSAQSQQDQLNLKRGIDLAELVLTRELQCQHIQIALETLLLRSQMYALLGDNRQAAVDVARALELGEPEGFISVFVEAGKAIADTLAALRESDLLGKVQPGYVREILAAFPSTPSPEEKPSESPPAKSQTGGKVITEGIPLAEPLTPRELEVLRQIADGDSNRTIAEKLVITVSAVKKHTGNIYGKLNVNSRTQAIARARQLGLLPADA